MDYKRKRIDWIDVSKGLGIILVVLGHTGISHVYIKEIFTFHMPLFFWLSGYVFDDSKYKSLKLFVKKRFKLLIIPYFMLSLINYFFYVLVDANYNLGEISSYAQKSGFIKPFIGMLISKRSTSWAMNVGPLWFLPCLFICEVIFFYMIKIFRKDMKKIILILIILSAIGYLYSTLIKHTLPWAIDASFTGVVFYGFGYIIKKKVRDLKKVIFKVRFFIIFLLINIISGYLNSDINMFTNKYGNYILFYISAFSGIFAILIVSIALEKNRLIINIGQNTIVYLAFHQTIILPVIYTLIKNTDIIFMYQNNNFQGVLFTIVTIIFLFIISKTMNKHLKFLIGK